MSLSRFSVLEYLQKCSFFPWESFLSDWVLHLTFITYYLFYFWYYFKGADLSRSSVCSDKVSVDFPRLPFPHYLIPIFFFFSPRDNLRFYCILYTRNHPTECMFIPFLRSIPWHLRLLLCFSMEVWEIGFPRFPLSSVTLVMILGASMLKEFTLTMIFYDTQNILW